MSNLTPVEEFYKKIPHGDLKQIDYILYFLLFLTQSPTNTEAFPAQIDNCFEICKLHVPGNTGARLKELSLKGRSSKVIKTKQGGFKLERNTFETLLLTLGEIPAIQDTDKELQTLSGLITDPDTLIFYKEVISCYRIGAHRSAITMMWCMSLDHIFNYVLKHKLTEFNHSLSLDKGVKLSTVLVKDDFIELKESKFIELLRAAGIITNDIRKVLDEKLGIRNSAAHPSSITFTQNKVVEVIKDLLQNIVLKFKV